VLEHAELRYIEEHFEHEAGIQRQLQGFEVAGVRADLQKVEHYPDGPHAR